MNGERHDCPRCNSAGSVEHELCQVCLTEYRLERMALSSDLLATRSDLEPIVSPRPVEMSLLEAGGR